MKTFSTLLDKSLSALAAVALVAMMVHTVLSAVLRYQFKAPIYGTNEVVTYWYLPVLVLLGFLAAQIRKEHISVSLLYERLTRRNQVEYTVFINAIAIIVCAGFVWFGFEQAVENMSSGLTAGVTTILVWPVTFLVPVVFTLLGLLYLLDLLEALKSADSNNQVSALVDEDAR